MRVQALSAHVAALAASKAVVPTRVPAARRPSGAWCMPSVAAADWAAAVSSEYTTLDRLTAETEGGGEGCQGMEGPHGGCPGTLEKVSSANATGRARPISATCSRVLQGQRKKQWP
jgi:hypothetical protein